MATAKKQVKRVSKGSVYAMVFSKSAFPQSEIDRIKSDFESAGAKLILVMYNLNAKEIPTIQRIG